MKTAGFLFPLALAAASLAAQEIDLSALDKLANRAKESNTISLDGDSLKTASKFLSGSDPDMQQAKAVVEGLKGIWVRNFEFKSKEEYGKGDLAPIFKQLKAAGWSKIVDSRDENENTEIFLHNENQKTVGLAIVAQEPKALTVVLISGSIDMDRLGKLSGTLGIPDIELKHKAKPPKDED